MKLLFSLLFLFVHLALFGQIDPSNGVQESKQDLYFIKNATIYVSPTKKMNNACMIIEKGKVKKVGLVLASPKGAVDIDMNGKTIVPSFIDLCSQIGLPDPKGGAWNPRPQYESNKKGAYYWNEAIHPEVDGAINYVLDNKENEKYTAAGFGYALTHVQDGISRGTGALVSTGLDTQKELLYNWTSTAFFSFSKGVSKQAYPSSQMGSIALLRQAIYDAQWYDKAENKQTNLSLDALNDQLKNNKIFFQTNDELELLRAQKIAKEFGLTFQYLGSGKEYKITSSLKDQHVVIPINFPEAYDVENPYIARQIPLSDLKEWELAPNNPRILADSSVSFSITFSGHKSAKEFWQHLRKAIENGLTVEDALNALTLEPAKILEVQNRIGSLDEGRFASFMVYDKDPFKFNAKLLESWDSGDRHLHEFIDHEDVTGKFNLAFSGKRIPIEITGEPGKLKGKIKYTKTTKDKRGKVSTEEKETDASVVVDHRDINIQFIFDDGDLYGNISLRGKINPRLKIFEGEGFLPNGEWINWSGIRTSILPQKESKEKALEVCIDTNAKVWYPNLAYGFDNVPEGKAVVVENTTLWTNEDQGVIEHATIILENGKISYVGTGKPRYPKGAIVINGEGKHVTSGIIDEHSHIAISKGVNESGQAVSAEVSIGDVVNPEDINIYRQLSGGVTAAQLLHGSANPIGGQSALIKLKWGHSAEDMLIDNASGFIKFALGENVKQANWGDFTTTRFPQTRMGVEQVYYDAFIRAQKYEQEKIDFANGVTKEAPRVDLELEVLNQILNKERFVSCHSYVQSEINMLMHVADSFGFTLNTFTHILEGYKVADKMAAHGAGGSTFSDWWAYKYEVNDAIPYNAALMSEQGIVVAINSDDAEMGRRLNQEAAKGIKYGGMSQEDAWKMVTLNPAKLLHLDDHMGSLKQGKDADIVVWSDNPLSIKAKVEQTIIDGMILYDKDRDMELRKTNQEEKARIISKMLASNEKGDSKRNFFKKKEGHYHCNTIGEEMSTEQNEH